MRRFKIFWILLVFILFILPVQGFGEENDYTPEEIIKLLHDLGYEYCKKEPNKDIFDNIVWNAVIRGYDFDHKYTLRVPSNCSNPKSIEDMTACKLIEEEIFSDQGISAILLVYKNYKILGTETIYTQKFKLELKKVKVLYDRIGIFDPLIFGDREEGCIAGFCFKKDQSLVNYYFVRTSKGWRLFVHAERGELYDLPVPPCAVIKQYKTVYLKVTPENFKKYVCEDIRVPTTNKIKKEILTVIKELQK
jgi:hypothetical protein